MPNADDLYYLNPSIFQSFRVTIQTTSVNDFLGLISGWKERQKFCEIEQKSLTVASRESSQLWCSKETVKQGIDICVPYIEFNLASSGTFLQQNRKYKTFTEACGELGGIQGVVMIILLLIYQKYNENAYYSRLVKEVFGLRDPGGNNICHRICKVFTGKYSSISTKVRSQDAKEADEGIRLHNKS